MPPCRLVDLPIPLSLPPMEAIAEDALPSGAGWWFEPKWDGFRCLAFRAGSEVELIGRSGKSLARFFPDMAEALLAFAPPFVLDGELAIERDGALSFEALQMRLHPAASRVARLAREEPAMLIAFDCLVDAAGSDLAAEPLRVRREALERLAGGFPASRVRLTPGTRSRSQALAWLDAAGGDLDGVVAKRLDAPYSAGEGAMVKVKRWRTIDCVVGGWRPLGRGGSVGALLLGLYDEAGGLHHVGFTSAISDQERPALTRRLEALAGPSAFTGAGPGGPSRWSGGRERTWRPLKPTIVAEVAYDHAAGDRLRHGARLIRLRPDKPPKACLLSQLRGEAAPARLISELALDEPGSRLKAPRRGPDKGRRDWSKRVHGSPPS
ncbi:MAG: ATP-dependent DNA ligase [Caulobacteraceae bacterium]